MSPSRFRSVVTMVCMSPSCENSAFMSLSLISKGKFRTAKLLDGFELDVCGHEPSPRDNALLDAGNVGKERENEERRDDDDDGVADHTESPNIEERNACVVLANIDISTCVTKKEVWDGWMDGWMKMFLFIYVYGSIKLSFCSGISVF